MFSQEITLIREQEALLDNLEIQMERELSEIATLQSQLKNEMTLEKQRKSQFSANEPGSIEDEEREAEELRNVRDRLQERLVLYLKENFGGSTILQARKELQDINLELTNKTSLIRGLQGREPLSNHPAALQNHRKGRFYAQGLPNLRRRQAAIESRLSNRMQAFSKIRATRDLETASLEKQVRALEASARRLAQMEISEDALTSNSFSSSLQDLLLRWKSYEVSPPDNEFVEYFERRNNQRGIARTWLMNDLDERGLNSDFVLTRLNLLFTENLSIEVLGEILILARREFGDFFQELLDFAFER